MFFISHWSPSMKVFSINMSGYYKPYVIEKIPDAVHAL